MEAFFGKNKPQNPVIPTQDFKIDPDEANVQLRQDRAEGSILGAFIGDSIGAAVEF